MELFGKFMQQFLHDASCFLHETANILPLLVEDNIIQISCEFDITHFNSLLLVNLPTALQMMINNAAKKRQAEFIAGRYCVVRALMTLTNLDNYWVSNRSDRSPLWPEGIVGSISHSKTIATAIVARQSYARSVGVDIEAIIPDQQARQLASIILAGSTLTTNEYSFSQFVTLIFSAKETLFKAIYPLLGKMMDFDDVICTLVDSQRCICRLILQKGRYYSDIKQREFDIAYAFNETSVMTRLLIPTMPQWNNLTLNTKRK